MDPPLTDLQLLSLSVRELALALRLRRVTAVQALAVYKRRAQEVDAACNALTCYVQEAEQWAQEADAHLERTGKVLGPLHGVPCSIKDHFALKDHPVTMGLEKLKNRNSKMNSAVVIALKQAGAVPFCKTTMSQLGNTWGGGSPAHGDTLNPWDTMRTSGGSSCGEGALVGGGGSPFGIGSDVGGSVRIPATFCGLCTLKPTAKRLTFNWEDGRTILNHDGDYGVLATAGPMARSVEDLVEVLAALWTEPLFALDPRVPPMPLRRELLEEKRPLRIGWYVDGYVYPTACASSLRAVSMAKEALAAAGHELVEFKCSTVELLHVRQCDRQLHAFDNSAEKEKPKEPRPVGNYGGGPLKGERIHPDLAAAFGTPSLFSKPDDSVRLKRPNTPVAYQAAVAWRDRLRDSFLRYWRENKLDVVLSPAWPFPAPPVEEVRNAHFVDVCSARLYNFMDMPAGIVPVTHVQAQDLSVPYDPQAGEEHMERAAKAAVEGSLGLPVAVQLAALPWQEEVCLRAMLEVQARLPFSAAQHSRLAPTPRRSPELGARPEPVQASPASKL